MASGAKAKGKKIGRGRKRPSSMSYKADMRDAKNKRLRQARHKKFIEKKAKHPAVRGAARNQRRVPLQQAWAKEHPQPMKEAA